MSVYIKGFKYPENCWQCPMVGGYELSDEVKARYSTLHCRLTKTRTPAGEKPKDCPLIPVPDHGRLLDESKIFEMLEVQREYEYNKTHKPKATWSRVMDCFEALLGIVDTAIPSDKDSEE